MFDADKTRMIGLPYGEKKTMTIQYRNVTTDKTDKNSYINIARSVLTRDKN